MGDYFYDNKEKSISSFAIWTLINSTKVWLCLEARLIVSIYLKREFTPQRDVNHVGEIYII